MRRFYRAMGLCCGLALVGCGQKETPVAAPPAVVDKAPAPPVVAGEKVIESYNVGDTVYVRALKVDHATNSMWVGTSAGLHEIDLKTQKALRTFTRDDGLANEYVFGIGIDVEGHKWFGTNAGGVSRYKDGKWKTFFPMHGLADYWIYCFANDKQGNLWIGTWAGANKYEPKTGKFTTYVKELINEWVYGLDVDKQGNVWFGTEGGVSMFDGQSWKSWNHKDGLGGPNSESLDASPNTGLDTRSRHDLSTLTAGKATYNPNYVFSILVAQDGAIWAGTWGGGVSRFDGKTWTSFTKREGLSGNIVYSIAQDAGGVLWFGTESGLTRYDGKSWRHYGANEGMLDSNVYALAVAPNGDIWAGTRRGVTRLGKR